MAVTEHDVDHVARLARLRLGEEEKESLTRDMNAILKYVEKLAQADTTGVEPMSHPLSITNVLRRDCVEATMSPEDAMRNAPDPLGGFFRVPRILELE